MNLIKRIESEAELPEDVEDRLQGQVPELNLIKRIESVERYLGCDNVDVY